MLFVVQPLDDLRAKLDIRENNVKIIISIIIKLLVLPEHKDHTTVS